MVITSRQIRGVTVTDWPCGMLVLLLHIIMYLCMLLYFWVFQLDLMAEGDIGWGTLDLYRPALVINHDSRCKGQRSFNLEYKTLSGLRTNSQADPSHDSDFIFHNQVSNFVRVQTVSTYKLLHTNLNSSRHWQPSSADTRLPQTPGNTELSTTLCRRAYTIILEICDDVGYCLSSKQPSDLVRGRRDGH